MPLLVSFQSGWAKNHRGVISPPTLFPGDVHGASRARRAAPRGGQAAQAVALGGVFTLEDGVWTVPIVVGADGGMSMRDPDDPAALRQGFNVYESARLSLWSESRRENWFVSFGGLGYQVLADGELSARVKLHQEPVPRLHQRVPVPRIRARLAPQAGAAERGPRAGGGGAQGGRAWRVAGGARGGGRA